MQNQLRLCVTPGHFISLNPKTGCPDITPGSEKGTDTSSKLLQMWITGQKKLDVFWKTWVSQYLQQLKERKTYKMKAIKGEVKRKPQVGEVVLIKEENQPRGRWKIAKVQNLIKGDFDNQYRAAKLILPSGLIVKRPFKLIFPVEIDSRCDEEENAP